MFSLHRIIIAALLIIAPNWKQLICPSLGEWIKKLCHIYTVEVIHLTNKIHRAAWRGDRLTRKHHKGTLWERGNVLFSFGEGVTCAYKVFKIHRIEHL